MSSTILSTKKLTLSQKELLLNAKLSFVEYDAITITYCDVSVETNFDYYLFTSQNAVNAYLKSNDHNTGPTKEAFCVGEKTKLLLEGNGFKVIETASNASSLADCIIENYQKSSFLFLCGNMRMDTLPDALKKYNIQYKEVEVYQTVLNPKKFDRYFSSVLFFSPSGVQSFASKNPLDETTAFCIGETTAKEVKKYTNRFVVANKPTIENVIVQAIKYNDL